jgi:tetratricopeptide (TPR) repeat protein
MTSWKKARASCTWPSRSIPIPTPPTTLSVRRCSSSKQLAAAEKEFREAIRLNASPDNHYSLAACLMTMDRYEEALAELETAARLDPERTLYRARRDELLKLMQIKETNSR